MALNVLLHDPDISVEDAKAPANLHGVKITAASVAAAKRLLFADEREEPRPPAAAATNGVAPVPPRPTRRVRPADQGLDAEALIRGVAVKGQGSAEAERLRGAIRKAIATLQAAVGA